MIARILLFAALFLVALGMIFPLAWMILLSLREQPERFAGIAELLAQPTTLVNWVDALNSDSFGRYFLNSLFVAACVTAGNIFFGTAVAWAFARRSFPGKSLLFGSVLGVLIVPPHVIMIPLYRLMVEFGWINTYAALIVPWLVAPMGIFMVRQYIASLPADIEDAARIDGAGEWYILTRIVFPLCRPILTVLGIYTFLSNWNSFLFPFLFVNDEVHRTLPVGLAFYIGKQSIDWGHLMAGAAISAVPVLVLFLVFQRQIIQGLTAGAVKE